LATRFFEPFDLGDRRLDIGSFRRAHALKDDLVIAADR
jgi:hypothetical protein